MSDQYVGEIRAFGFNFAPVGWVQCNGQLLPISQYAALFSLIGTYYGGNGTSNFGLPNLQGNVPMQWGNGAGLSQYYIGEQSGATAETLTASQLPVHSHAIQVAKGPNKTPTPSATAWIGVMAPSNIYPPLSATPNTMLAQTAIGPAGGGQPHDNMQPYNTVNFCIALQGAFPPRG